MTMQEALIHGLHNGFAIVGVLSVIFWLVWGKVVIDRAERFTILRRLAADLMDDYESVCARAEKLQERIDSFNDKNSD